MRIAPGHLLGEGKALIAVGAQQRPQLLQARLPLLPHGRALRLLHGPAQPSGREARQQGSLLVGHMPALHEGVGHRGMVERLQIKDLAAADDSGQDAVAIEAVMQIMVLSGGSSTVLSNKLRKRSEVVRWASWM